MTIDISEDYLLEENYEEVTFTIDPSNANTQVTVSNASRRQINRQEIEFGGAGITADDIAWILPDAQLSGNAPQPYDTITDSSGNVYTIGSSIQKRQMGNSVSHWRCATVKQR